MAITEASDMFTIAEYRRRRRKAGAPLYQGSSIKFEADYKRALSIISACINGCNRPIKPQVSGCIDDINWEEVLSALNYCALQKCTPNSLKKGQVHAGSVEPTGCFRIAKERNSISI